MFSSGIHGEVIRKFDYEVRKALRLGLLGDIIFTTKIRKRTLKIKEDKTFA